ncbi:unnamed protein product [marine sediment metagenome]|uniref:Uncharacterized protein n=1 Tax=marine sediment metagenome TaxID=412755 RepID=X1UAI5_9ZZZZ
MPDYVVYAHYTVLCDWTYHDIPYEKARQKALDRLDTIRKDGNMMNAVIDEIKIIEKEGMESKDANNDESAYTNPAGGDHRKRDVDHDSTDIGGRGKDERK